MRSSDILILAIAAGAAWLIVSKAKAATAAPVQQAGGLTPENLAWYLNDIYSRLNAEYA